MRTTLLALLLLGAAPAWADEFKTADQCKPGVKVTDRQDKPGTITGVSNGMCRVRLDDGSERSYLHWMLRPAGARRDTSDRLASGKYECYHSGGYSFIDIHIDGPAAYRDKKGVKGEYRLDPATNKIEFTSGSLKGVNAKLLAGPRIGLNMNGGKSYNTTCAMKKQ